MAKDLGVDQALKRNRTLDESVKEYIKTTNTSKLSISGFNQYLNQQAAAAQKAAIGTQLASTALNGLMSFGISAGISAAFSLISNGISYLIHYKEEAVKTARESAEAFSSSVSTLDSQKSKIQELRDSLDSGTLSETETLSAKSQLFDIQQQLISTYGEQARGIDLVNGSLEHELSLMDHLSQRDVLKFHSIISHRQIS